MPDFNSITPADPVVNIFLAFGFRRNFLWKGAKVRRNSVLSKSLSTGIKKRKHQVLFVFRLAPSYLLNPMLPEIASIPCGTFTTSVAFYPVSRISGNDCDMKIISGSTG
ncbi:MAG: hypothetical protein ABW019_16185, partial [Chitinophagaceae bacterium]